MRDIRLIALDLDQTTLRSDKTISPATREVLEAAADAGICLTIASGRSFESLPEAVHGVRGISYAITSNGAAIYDMKTKTRIHEFLLKPESVDRILRVLPDHKVWEAFIDGVPYAWAPYVEDAAAYGVPAGGARYVKATRKPVEDMRKFLAEHRSELDSLDVIVPVPLMDEVRRKIRGQVDGIYMTSSAPLLLEISDAAAGKHQALQLLADQLHILREQTAAFGDAENDRDMLLWAGVGVAVANASPAAKEAADELTDSNDEDGVARKIMEWMQ